MPSSAPEDWRDGLYQDLARDAKAAPRFSRYELLGEIGEGATGIVHRALHRELNQLVAIKVLRPILGRSEIARQRFRREAQTAAGLSHPNLVAVRDAGEENGQLYLVMELVEGKPLAVSAPEALRLLEDAARGVGAAHAAGIVHRDLKPANLLITEAGVAKVADFGLAHLVDDAAELTRTGSTLGTPLYMAPEQIEGRAKDITPRTDVYALGAMLYEILGGRPPHEGATPLELYQKILRDEPRPLGSLGKGARETIARRALEKDPARRYADATAFAEDLRRAREGEPIEARPAGLLYRAYRGGRKRWMAWSVAAAALLALAAIAAERAQRVGLLREHARVSLDAVLKLRRAGANREMAAFVPALEAAYRQAPSSAEGEYLMGRMQRALLDDAAAEAFQERALAKDPDYAPALYERAILRAARYGTGLGRAIAASRSLPEGPVTAKTARELPPPDPEGNETLAQLREGILQDCAALERRLPDGAELGTIRGILAFHRKDYEEARRILESVVRVDPLLEDGWHALGTTVSRQATSLEAVSENRDEVLRRFDDAEALWTRAIAVDAGYAPHRLGRALVNRSRGLFYMKRGGDAVPAFRKSEADLGRTRELASSVTEALFRRANVRDLIGICLMGEGKDPSADFDAAEQDLGEGMDRLEDRGEFWIARAGVRLHRALWRARKQEDPFPGFAAAEEDLLQALKLERWADTAGNSLGNLKITRSGYRRRRNEDPLPDLLEAERDLSDALRRNREFTSAWINRGWARMEKALLRGEAGAEDLVQAEEDLTEAIRLTPTSADAWARRGSARTQRARRLETSKAAALAASALEDFTRAIALNASMEARNAGELAEARRLAARR